MMKTLLLMITALFVFSSCKKCDPSNSVGGEVIENAVIKVISSSSMPILITDASQVPYSVEVSFDGDISYQPVNFAQHSVLSLPTTASCSSGYDRSVVVDELNETVTYTITITECETCEGSTSIQNWVLIPSVPASYTPVFLVK